MNIITYAETELNTFKEKAFCEIDSLVLSQMSYLFYDGIVPGFKGFSKNATFKDIYRAEYFQGILNLVRFPSENRRLFAALAASPRFRNVKLNYYVNDIDIHKEKQFSAITFVLDRKTAYIAFRGTDASIIGWKEDFNMAFLDEVPAQISAAEYVNKVAKLLHRKLIVGGHSKGGNLAVYAGAMCDVYAQNRIVSIFSHDGPGFKTLAKTDRYQNIKSKIYKTVPKTAIIGMVMDGNEDYKIVKSTSTGIMQHDPFSWELDESGFVTEEKISTSATIMNNTLHNLLTSMSDKERENFVNALFQLIQAANVNTVYDLEKIKLKDLKAFPEITAGLDPKAKKILLDTAKKLVFTPIRRL